jgi:hypothetical protein
MLLATKWKRKKEEKEEGSRKGREGEREGGRGRPSPFSSSVP